MYDVDCPNPGFPVQHTSWQLRFPACDLRATEDALLCSLVFSSGVSGSMCRWDEPVAGSCCAERLMGKSIFSIPVIPRRAETKCCSYIKLLMKAVGLKALCRGTGMESQRNEGNLCFL